MPDQKLILGDCLNEFPKILDKSIDLILTDPPYGIIKKAPSSWDKNKTYWDVQINNEIMFKECERILRFQGCLILFSQDPYTFKLALSSYKTLKYSYRYTCIKNKFGNHLGCKKSPVYFSEDICVFFNNYENKENHPLSNYFKQELLKSKKTSKQICDEMSNTGASHYFTSAKQFRIPSKKQYEQLQKITKCFKLDYKEIEFLFKKDANILIFNLENNKKYKSNILEFNKDIENYHTTQKPVKLLENLIKTYTNENDTVLDFTMGSGSTGVACKNLNRQFIGIELDKKYFLIAEKRIKSTLI